MSDKTIDNRQQGQQARQDSLEFRDQPPGLTLKEHTQWEMGWLAEHERLLRWA